MSKGKLALGAVVGAAVGALVGVLTAPKSGKETRADIKNKAHEVKDKAESTFEDTVDTVKKKTNRFGKK